MTEASQTIHDILDQFREEARSNRDLGDRFERLFKRFLALDPLYADRSAGPDVRQANGRRVPRNKGFRIRFRWGSSTPKNNLNFNWRLIKAPSDVIDYIIVHELAHLI